MEIETVSGKEARAKILKGAVKVGNIIGKTLGPRGRAAIIKTKYSPPAIHNDGVSVARQIMLEDEIEDLGAQTFIDGSMQTNDLAGDGTTTCMVLSTKILQDYSEKIKEEDKLSSIAGTVSEENNEEESIADVNKMAREILDTGKIVVEKLKKMAHPLKKEELKGVIATSMGSLYSEYTDLIADVVEKVGKDGHISVDDNWATKHGIDTEMHQGMKFLGTYVSPYMITNGATKEAVQKNVSVLVCNFDLNSLTQFQKVLEDPRSSVLPKLIAKGHRKIVFIVQSASKPLIKVLNNTILQSRGAGNPDMVDYLVIKAPALTTEQLEDVAVYCGAKFFDKNTEITLGEAQEQDFGIVKEICVDENDVKIINDKRNDALVKERIEILKATIENEKDPAFKKKAERRLGALQSGMATILVGASTEGERTTVKMKIEDAKNAAICALEEGVLLGGGLALKTIAEELGEEHPMYHALRSPYDRIQRSAGGELKIPDTVIDPLKVTRIAVEIACSVAASLLTVEIGIAEKRKTLLGEFEKSIYPREYSDENFRKEHADEKGYL